MLTVPGLCWLCRMPLALSHWGVCSVCEKGLTGRTGVCPQCGLPAIHPHLPCGRCLRRPPPWQALVAVSGYTPPLSQLVHQLKFSRRSQLAKPLARLLLLALLRARRSRGCRMLICWSAYRSGHGVTGGAGLTRATCSVARWPAG